MATVCVVGSLNRDVTIQVATHPAPGETVPGERTDTALGGKGANQAIAAALHGARTVMVGRVGDDDAGRQHLARLRGTGMDSQHIAVDSSANTGTAYITVDRSGENSIVVVAGANAHLTHADVDAGLQRTPDVVLLQLEIPVDVAIYAARRAADLGCRVIINVSPYRVLPLDVLELADPLIVNEIEARQLPTSLSRPTCITRGADGAVWGSLTAMSHADVVVDTTGAGDAFAGALAARLAAGDSPQHALNAGVAAGALACAHRGPSLVQHI